MAAHWENRARRARPFAAGRAGSRDLCHSTAEVMADQHGVVKCEVVEPGEESIGLRGQAEVDTRAVGDARAVTGHLPRQTPSLDQRHDMAPQPG